MKGYKEIKPTEFNDNIFKLLYNDWGLVSAQDGITSNTMTVSWGGLGIMWNKNVVYIVVRPQRFTKTLLDKSNQFSLSFYPEEHKNILRYFGKTSAYEEDKINNTNFNIVYEDDIPFFKEASIVFLCKNLYAQKYKEDNFLDKSLFESLYPENDLHTLYIAEIKKILIKDN